MHTLKAPIPAQDGRHRAIRDLMNMEDTQLLQDVFAAATGVSLQIVRQDGSPVTEPSGEASGDIRTFPLHVEGQALALWRVCLPQTDAGADKRFPSIRSLLGLLSERLTGNAVRREQMIRAMGSKSMRAAALFAANRELEAHIAERTRQLAGSQAELEEKSAELEELNASLQSMNAELEDLNGELQDMNAMLEEEIEERQRAEEAAELANARLEDANARLASANESLSRMNHVLEERVRERTRSLLELNALLEEEIRENRNISYHDSLTGLYNRRFFEEELKRLDVPRNLPLSIVMGDMNGLKLVNDAFGHAKGDELLCKAARAIQSACRRDDIVARWGGDEFVILLPKTSSVEAEEIVGRIRRAHEFEHVNSVRVSLSYGWETKLQPEHDMTHVLKSAEDYMYKHKLIENAGLRGNAITTIINALHEKNPREELHSKRVSDICQQLGASIGLSSIEAGRYKLVGLLHDIGKIAIDEDILNKPGRLSDAEFEEIRRHPDIGYRILSTSHDMQDLADCVLAHHERWDGQGYPKGLRGEEIPLVARIIMLADSYDAMTCDRPYRRALSSGEAIAEIRRCAGTQFDPNLAERFARLLENGSWTD